MNNFVHFLFTCISVPPILHVPNQLVGATLNQKVTLLCISEAYPKSINYWIKGNGEMVISGNVNFFLFFKLSNTQECVLLTKHLLNSLVFFFFISFFCLSDKKFEIIYKHDLYTTNMIMIIHKVDPEDFCTYTCVSINPLGNTDGIIKLYGMYCLVFLNTIKDEKISNIL